MSRRYAVIAALLITVIWWVYDMYQDNQRIKADNTILNGQLAEQIAVNKDYQERAQKLYELDVRHIQELTNAKTEIDRLRIAVERNPERMYIKASCPKTGSVTATGMDDAVTARPDDATVRNYWLLRGRIEKLKLMVKGLQEYIIIECMK